MIIKANPNLCIVCQRIITSSTIGSFCAIKTGSKDYTVGFKCEDCTNALPTNTEEVSTKEFLIHQNFVNQQPVKKKPVEKTIEQEKEELRKEIARQRKFRKIPFIWAWISDGELRKAFDYDFNRMRDFAETYGYGSAFRPTMLRHMRDMKRHKLINEELKKT